MSDGAMPWEPPMAGTETEHLRGALNRLRTTFRWKADGLDASQLNTPAAASTLTIGGLLKHLAFCEDYMFTVKMAGEEIGAPWTELGIARPSEAEVFTSASRHTPDFLYSLYDDAVERSEHRVDDALENGDLGQLVQMSFPDGTQASLRRLLFDLIEEYGRHTGHADLIREAIDGRVGEDPPSGWRRESNPAG